MIRQSSREGENKQYVAVDCAKLFFCLCIITLHCGMHTVLGSTLAYGVEKLVFRLAVPFFFVVSGFFMGKRIKRDLDIKEVVKKYVLRLLFPLTVFGGVNVLLEIIKMAMEDKGICEIVSNVLQHILFYPYGALWYVTASIFGAILLYPFLKKDKINLAVCIGILLYIFALLCNNYYFVSVEIPGLQMLIDNYLEIFISSRNGLFVGFLFLALGVKTESIEVKIIGKQRNQKILFILLICVVLYVVEIVFVAWVQKIKVDDGALYVSHIILIPVLVLWLNGLKCEVLRQQSSVFRQLSVGMYFLHRIILLCIYILEQYFQVTIGNVIVRWSAVIVISSGICLIARLKKGSLMYKLLS